MSFINMVYAANMQGIIGNKGQLPWHVPEDLKRFKELTMGHHVVMGRKTWESLPEKVRPLPDRKNIVISARWADVIAETPGIEVFKSCDEVALQYRWNYDPLWVIGGNQIYQRFLPFTNYVYKTEIDFPCDGDTLAPRLDVDEWELNSEGAWMTSSTGIRYRNLIYRHYTTRN